MSRQRIGQTPASFLREQGWDVGTILAGSPILRGSTQVERGQRFRVTAIGEEAVLARHMVVPDLTKDTAPSAVPWSGETSVTFDARDWRAEEVSGVSVREVVPTDAIDPVPSDQKCDGCDKCRMPGSPATCDYCGRFTQHRWFLGYPDDPTSWCDYWLCSQQQKHRSEHPEDFTTEGAS